MGDKLFKIIYGLIVALLVTLAALLVVAAIPIPGNYKIKIVQSGSMEPAISTGSVVVIKSFPEYKIGDVITFGRDTKTSAPTTHRIIEMRAQTGSAVYITKGDANNTPDKREVRHSEVIGKVLFHIPALGYLLDFAKKPIGFIFLVVIPAALIVFEEMGKIWKEFKRIRAKKAKPAVSEEERV